VISAQKHLGCKKGTAIPKKSKGKKIVKSKWRPRNGCDDRLMAKTLIITIQENSPE